MHSLTKGPRLYCLSSASMHVHTSLRRRLFACAGISLIAGLFSGCSTRLLAPDFSSFSSAYARDMNWQMLLNLARLDQGHPAYFMAIGEIRLARSQSTSLQGSGSNTHTTGSTVAAAVTRSVSEVFSGSLSPSTTLRADPTFLFIPINSEEASRQLLAPIPIEVFNTLYQQGWPVDQLLRVLVERIEVDVVGEGDEESRRIVLTNSPTRGTPDSFARFLRTCELIRALQKAGALSLVADVRSDDGPGPQAVASSSSRPTRGGKAGEAADEPRSDASRAGYRFRANTAILDQTLASFSADAQFTGDHSLQNLRTVFLNSNLLVGSRTDPGGMRSVKGTRAVLVLRSFRNLLEAVASEQRAFDELAHDPSFARQLPSRQQRPVLRTDWTDSKGQTLLPSVIALEYTGRSYRITDPAGSEADLDTRWNRDVFRLLVNLSSQVTVDITKFQRQVLELTQ